MDLLLRTYLYTTVVAGLLRDRLSQERGQTALEYVGILVIVGAVIAIITTAGIPGRVGTALTTALNQIFGGGGGGPAPGGP